MDKLISEQAAIDAVVAWTVEDRPDIEMPTDLVGRIKALPSAQPDLGSAYTEGYTQAEAKYRKMWDEMPKRLIDANALKAKAFGKRKGLIHTADIDAMPTIEPEHKTGEWIPEFNGKFTGGAYWFRCSECGRIVPDVRNGGWDYCPKCGARMKVKAREMPKDVVPGKFGEKICNDFRNGIPLAVEGVKGEDNE